MSTPGSSRLADRLKPSLNLGDHVRSLQWSPDGSGVLVALASGELVRVHAERNEIERRWNAHAMGVLTATYCDSGRIIVSTGEESRVRWWKVEDGSMLKEERGKNWTEQAVWSEEAGLLALACGKAVSLRRADGSLAAELPVHESSVSAIAWRGDAKGLGTACFGHVRLFRLGESKPYEDLAWKTSFLSLAWSPNGRHVAAGSHEKTITYWKLPFREREPLYMSGYAQKIKCLSWDRESRFLASDGGDEVTVWDVSGKGPAGSKPIVLSGHGHPISALAFSPKVDLLASGCAGGGVRLWNPQRGDAGLPAAQLEGEVTQVAWAPDGSRLCAATSQGALQFIQ